MSDRKIFVSIGKPASLAVITHGKRTPWEGFAKRLLEPPPVLKSKDARGWYCCAEFRPTYRDSDNFVARSALTLDFDKVDMFVLDEVREGLKNTAHVIYPTYSHTPDAPRFRCVVPLSRPVSYDEFQAVSRKIGELIGIENLARESHVPSQCMFLPARPEVYDGEGVASANLDGPFLDVDLVLGSYKDWRDRASWPHRAEHDGTHSSEALTSPLEKVGAVGDFCRALSIEDCIERFHLPYVRAY